MSSESRGVREYLIDFINMYRSEPSLWQIQNKDYHNREKKTAAYNRLVQALRQIDPTASRATVTKKINGLRTTYRKEKRKIEISKRSRGNDVYQPTLWYYDLLKFVDEEQGSPRSSRSDIDYTEVHVEEDSEENESVVGVTIQETDFMESEEYLTPNYYEPRHSRPRKRSSNSLDQTALSNERFQSIPEHFKRPIKKDDRFDVFGKNVAMKLRDLPKQQRLIAEKMINDALFLAEMGNLTLTNTEQQQPDYIKATPAPSPPAYQE